MKIATGIDMLTLEVQAFGQRSLIHPSLLWDSSEAVLVDAGMPGQLEAIRAAVTGAGVPSSSLKSMIITHQDIDHCGSVSAMQEQWGHPIRTYAHELDAPYLDGTKHPIKMDLSLIGERLQHLPEPMRTEVERMCHNPPRMRIDATLTDGVELPLCGGITVIHTPGHTPGHMSLYVRKSRTLIAADALEAQDGRLQGPSPHNTPDMPTAMLSLKKLLRFPIDRIVCYHGGLCDNNAQEQLRQLVDAL